MAVHYLLYLRAEVVGNTFTNPGTGWHDRQLDSYIAS